MEFCVEFVVLTDVAVKTVVFWDVTPCVCVYMYNILRYCRLLEYNVPCHSSSS
jgi:hypothetical protein